METMTVLERLLILGGLFAAIIVLCWLPSNEELAARFRAWKNKHFRTRAH